MKIAHVALWTRQLEQQARFWTGFFNGQINEKYCSRTNPGFESYFVKIGEDITIELMSKPGLQAVTADNNHAAGFIWLSLSAARSRSMRWPGGQKPWGF